MPARLHSVDTAPVRKKDRASRLLWWILAALFVLVPLTGFLLSSTSGYRSRPLPDGLVMQVELPEVDWLMGSYRVEVVDANGPLLLVSPNMAIPGIMRDRLYRFPAAERLSISTPVQPKGAVFFDFDGDGVEDEITSSRSARGAEVRVQVLSGADGAVLFDYSDPNEYESDSRGFALGDLDGDGFSELALVHPRTNRSGYDWVLTDALLDVKSWVSVVSGAAATATR